VDKTSEKAKHKAIEDAF